MVLTFGMSTVSAEKNTTKIDDRISELAEVKRREMRTSYVDT